MVFPPLAQWHKHVLDLTAFDAVMSYFTHSCAVFCFAQNAVESNAVVSMSLRPPKVYRKNMLAPKIPNIL